MVTRFFRRVNNFEKFLLFIGMVITVVGFYFINRVYEMEGYASWALLQSSFLYLLLILMVILTDSNESIKEELKDVIEQHIEETKILKEISNETLHELKKAMGSDIKKRSDEEEPKL